VESPNDSLAWYTILQAGKGIGLQTLQQIETSAVDSNVTFAVALDRQQSGSARNSRVAKLVKDANEKLEKAKASRAAAPDVSWGDWIASLAVDLCGASLPAELREVFREMDARLAKESVPLSYYLSQLAPTMKDLANEQQIGVRFMTMNGSKGLTARATFVVGVDDNLIPSPMNRDRNEEIRLLYVAMTRAQERLVMTWATKRAGNQARSGRESVGKRNHTDFLRHGPVQSVSGEEFVATVVKGTGGAGVG
jgi:superfamily I DNA/RNA helicase